MLLMLSIVAMANPFPSGNVGVGIALGAPTGFVGKMYLGESLGVQLSIGSDLGEIGNVGVTTDVVNHFSAVNNVEDGYSIFPYAGGGITASASSRTTTTNRTSAETFVGPRGIIGCGVVIDGLSGELFVEVAPTIYVVQRFSWGVDGQLGIRYYF